MSVYARPLSRVKIRKIAEAVRCDFNVRNVLDFPIIEVIEFLVYKGEIDLEIVSEQEMNDTYGVTNTVRNNIRIQESVYNGAIEGNPRHRFTVCHELGHWLLHQPERISYPRGEVPKYCDPEWQANVFAAEIMVPYYLVGNMSADEISDKCKVSYTCANIQKKYY